VKVIPLHKNLDRLIEKAKTDDRNVQHQLYEFFAPKMLGVCRQYIKDTSVAEEIMLNGFFKVFTQIKSFKNEGSFEGWIRRIMVRESISFLRKKKQIHFLDEDKIGQTTEHATYIESPLDIAYIQELIDALPEGYKLVFMMYAIEGYKHSEIASELEISESTSKSQLFKARKMLKKKLNEQNATSYGTN